MTPDEQRARTLLLAQALAQADPQGRLVRLDERDAAVRRAVDALKASPVANAANASGAHGARTGPGPSASSATFADAADPADLPLAHAWADGTVHALQARHHNLGALDRPGRLWRAVAGWLVVAALLAGIVTNHVGDPHRLDLLAWPLIAVVLWNVVVYLLLAVGALRKAPPGRVSLIQQALHAVANWRARRGGARGELIARFYDLWQRHTATLTLYRAKAVLHLAAAAWALGICVSLVGRGLSVDYRVGWESTFLSAGQVQALLSWLSWPVTQLWSQPPFTLAEVAALRDFATPTRAGDRWVYLYAGLLAVLVIAPRLALAGWAAWRARVLARGVAVDLGQPFWRALLAALRPLRITVGLAVADAATRAQLTRLLRLAADDPVAPHFSVTTAQGDALVWLEDDGGGGGSARDVAPQALAAGGRPPGAPRTLPDVVLQFGAAAVPPAWAGAPIAAVDAAALGAVWPQGPWLFDAAVRGLATRDARLQRLCDAWRARHDDCAHRAMAAMAGHLVATARALLGEPAEPASATTAAAPGQPVVDTAVRDELFTRLAELHRLDAPTRHALEALPAQRQLALTRKDITGTTGAAAGAATGAGIGGAVDIATAGLSLGAAAALGGIVGAGIGFFMASRRQKESEGELLQRLTERAFLIYLDVANTARVQAGAPGLPAAWLRAVPREASAARTALAFALAVKADAGAESAGAAAHALAGALAQAVARITAVPASGDGAAAGEGG